MAILRGSDLKLYPEIFKTVGRLVPLRIGLAYVAAEAAAELLQQAFQRLLLALCQDLDPSVMQVLYPAADSQPARNIFSGKTETYPLDSAAVVNMKLFMHEKIW